MPRACLIAGNHNNFQRCSGYAHLFHQKQRQYSKMLLLRNTRHWPSQPQQQLMIVSLILLSCAYCALAAEDNQTANATILATDFHSHVPLILSNNNPNLSATTQANSNITTTSSKTVPAQLAPPLAEATSQKVPLLRNATATTTSELNAAGVTLNFPPPGAALSVQQTPASVYYANYANQQNVMQLVRNVDARLRSIRNVEMRVATIQEIFDSMHMGSSTSSAPSPPMSNAGKNNSDAQQQSAANNGAVQQDLELFSKRLEKKLQKATHVVRELRDFFRINVTRLLLHQQHMQSSYQDDEDDDDDEVEDDDDEDMDAAEEVNERVDDFVEDSKMHATYLSSYIQACQQDAVPANTYAVENYNKQQIQILNYLKTDSPQSPRTHPPPVLFSSDDFLDRLESLQSGRQALQANAYIAEKVHYLKSTLTRMDDLYEPATSTGNMAPTNGKLKFLGSHFKHIYFLSRSDGGAGGVRVNADGESQMGSDLNFRRLFVAAIQRKCVCVVIDVGSAMNAELLELTKAFVANLLQLLAPSDLIAIITVSDTARHMLLDTYSNVRDTTGLYLATRDRKEEILSYVNQLGITHAATNHTLGFEYAFRFLHSLQNATLLNARNPIQLVYVTRGLLANLTDAMHVLQAIAQGQRHLLEPIAINTVAVVFDEKRLMHEKQFLSDITAQNYSKYDIATDDWYPRATQHLMGKFIVLTRLQPAVLLQACTAIFERTFEERFLSDTLEVHAPAVDASSGDVIISITHDVAPYGVVGVNLYLADLVEDIVGYQQQQRHGNKLDHTYAFLLTRTGATLAHPAFPRPSMQHQTPYPVDIALLENSTDFMSIRQRMLHAESGNLSTSVYRRKQGRTELMQRSYYWQRILGIYIVCLVSSNKRAPTAGASTLDQQVSSPSSLPIVLQRFTISGQKENHLPPPYQPQHYDYAPMPAVDLLYHRLDLLPSTNAHICRYFHQVATLDAVTLFLSASAFESPFTFLHNNRLSSAHTQVRTVETIMAYIKDSTGLLANPGLRPQIRYEVNALYNAMQHLRKRHQDARGSLKQHIIRRYIASFNGVLQVYPGCLLSGDYDATRRPWFRQAMQQPGKIITTAPYLDAGGAGYIITIAHTIFEGKANALHSIERDQPVAIVALDLPYAFYYKLILETTPLCQLRNIKCLLFEHAGFLVAHPSMMQVSNALLNPRRPYEHLTHKESYLANDILNHKTLVRKLACASYQNRTLQRHYVFNTSLVEILTNVVHGERTKYAISLVRGSNIFAAVLNSSCDGGAFCPCSTIDRVCLNCKRMDQTDCECPCECPMAMDMFDETPLQTSEVLSPVLQNYTQQYAYCDPPSERFMALSTTATLASGYQQLHLCTSSNCDAYGTQTDCLAVMGCEWCQQDMDGNAFTAAFCTAQAACFNGVLSSMTPYGDLDDADMLVAHGYNPGQKQNSYSAFGPIAGAIVVLGIVIGFAIYCYRHNVDSHAQEQFYVDSMQEENYGLPLSRFNFDDCQAHDEPPGGSGGYDHSPAQRNLIHPADISPYHVSTGSSYRRPPNGESDHGYSTMTPHEDSSDHQCFTLAEPLLLSDKRHSKSDTLSISTSISSPTNRHHHQNAHPHSHHYQQQHHPHHGKEGRYNLTSPKKYHGTASPASTRGFYEQTTLPLNDSTEEAAAAANATSHYILAPVTVHRHMETSES